MPCDCCDVYITVFKHARLLGCGVQTACAFAGITGSSLIEAATKKELWIFLYPGYSSFFFRHEFNGIHFSMQPRLFIFLLSVGNAKRNHIGSANKLSFDFASSPNSGHECTFGSVSLVCVCVCVRVLCHLGDGTACLV